MDSLVVVTAPDSGSLSKALSLAVGESFSWAYVGQSLEDFTRVKHCFLGRGDQIDTVGSIQSAAERLREPYLTYLYDIGRQLNSLRWWVTSISYRSVYQSETFFQACLLKVGLDLLRGWKGLKPLVLVVAEGPVRRAVKLNTSYQDGMKVEFIGFRKSGVMDPILGILRIVRVLARRAYFMFSEGRRMLQARKLVGPPYFSHEATSLLVSSVTSRNVQRGADFHTFFFGDLAYKLEDLGNRVALMPRVTREVPYQEVLGQVLKAPFPVCVPHRYLRFVDLLMAATTTIIKPPAPRPIPPLDGMAISPLVEADLSRYWIGNRAAHNLLQAAAVRRLADRGSQINRIIYVYENHPWERALCWQVRRSLPSATLVGYQHSRVPRMLLNFYLAPGGEKEAPLPD